MYLWEQPRAELFSTVREGNRIPGDAQPFLWAVRTEAGLGKLPAKPPASIPSCRLLELGGQQTARQGALNWWCGGYFF